MENEAVRYLPVIYNPKPNKVPRVKHAFEKELKKEIEKFADMLLVSKYDLHVVFSHLERYGWSMYKISFNDTTSILNSIGTIDYYSGEVKSVLGPIFTRSMVQAIWRYQEKYKTENISIVMYIAAPNETQKESVCYGVFADKTFKCLLKDKEL